ncbi:bifunctional tetrahydrofolate synthase/dihydrofolate synthase [Paraglaciecola marina]|uniref:bifunctional tetrahydrofolate synthase/dihydrofolate synthase n=1 Tax=Paraglaciecola marina TaxID=2500157 RepID=UPI00105EC4A4|nr:bifunctional tetrahydrofolate synthase/dihydrofolate synthase [Paraglaciecola marina]
MSDISTPTRLEQHTWNLETWLKYLESIHPSNIELGLDRVSQVFKNLNLSFSDKTVITVAGTNGKGTTCAFIEQALLSKKHSVAVFSSPHLIDYRERVRIQNKMLPEASHCLSFMQVEIARKDIALTYFEFGTLAALYLMSQSDADYILLEVGLGGRLDAVNIIDPDLAVITSIGLDHQDWLGETREEIAIEKAGIFRYNIDVVIGEPEPPKTLLDEVKRFQVKAYWQSIDFEYFVDNKGFHWEDNVKQHQGISKPMIPAQNVSTGLKALALLGQTFNDEQLSKIILKTKVMGRKHIIQSAPTVLLDVAHNPQATALLAKEIEELGTGYNRVIAVIAMLADKDIKASLRPMEDTVTSWYCADLNVPRGASANVIASHLTSNKKVVNFDSVIEAYKSALDYAQQEDLVVVFGSFFTVAEILNLKGLSLIEEA